MLRTLLLIVAFSCFLGCSDKEEAVNQPPSENHEAVAREDSKIRSVAFRPQQQTQNRPLPFGFRRTIESKILKEQRSLWVYLPPGYQPENKAQYPLLVLSDGPWDFRVAASVVHSLSIVGAIPQMVVVGVPNRHRDRDLIPMKVPNIKGSGGGANYLQSLETEVIPYIDTHWPTNGFRIFSGHSLGGLTALNILVEKPQLFDAYIALSPSMEVGDGVMLKRCCNFIKKHQKLDKMLYLAVGDEFQEQFYFDKLVAFLKKNAPKKLLWGSEEFDEQDDHNSMRVTGAIGGIRWVFRDWKLTSHRVYNMTFQEMETHYKEATRRYKQPRQVDMYDITGAVFWGLHRYPKKTHRAKELAELAIKKWPNHAEPHAAQSKCFELEGNFEKALQSMQRAAKIAEAEKDQDHLAIYNGFIDKLKAKLNRD